MTKKNSNLMEVNSRLMGRIKEIQQAYRDETAALKAELDALAMDKKAHMEALTAEVSALRILVDNAVSIAPCLLAGYIAC